MGARPHAPGNVIARVGVPAMKPITLAGISHRRCSRRSDEADRLRVGKRPPHHFGGYSVSPLLLIGEKCGLATRLIAASAIAAALFAAPTTGAEPSDSVWQRVFGAWLDGRYCHTAYGGGTDDARPVFADLDGDGDLDILMGDWGGWLTYYENIGNAQEPIWAPPVAPYAGIDVGNFSSPALADLDADGDLDLVLGEKEGALFFFKNIGDARRAVWASPVANYAGVQVSGWSAPVFGDLDSDGDADLLVGSVNGRLLFIERVGTSATPVWAAPVADYGGVDVGAFSLPTLADLDGDGDLDLMVGNHPATLTYYQNVGTPTAPVWSQPILNYNQIDLGFCAFPGLADIDADGDLDLFVGESQGALTYYKNIGNRTTPMWAPEISNYDAMDVGYMTMPVLADLDSDGDLDLLLGEWESGVTFYRNVGSAREPAWAAPIRSWVGAQVGSGAAPALGDLDGDGDLDLIVGETTGTLVFYRNNGTPRSPAWAAPVFHYASIAVLTGSRPALADLDGDGDLDLFVGDDYGTITHFENIGSPSTATWAAPVTSFASIDVGYYSAPAFGDVDRDGDLDLLVGDSEGLITYYENTGTARSAAWAPPVRGFAGVNVGWAAAPFLGDLDGDGDLDLGVGERDGGISVYRNLASRTAARQTWQLYR